MSQRAEWQTEIVLREQWINLAGHDAAEALSRGASAAEVMHAIKGAAGEQSPMNAGTEKSTALRRVARAALEALQRGASVDYVESRVAVLLSQSRSLSSEQASQSLGLDQIGFRKLCDDMAAAQREALRLTVDPVTFREQYR